MSVPQRIYRKDYNEPGEAHELTFSCFHAYQFLKAERTCQWLATAIRDARAKFDFDLWAFVFMPEHVHVIVHPRRPEYDIAAIRSAIKEPVGREAFCYLRRHSPEWIPRLTRRRGKRLEHMFWQSGGGYDRNINSSKALVAMIDYIHNNPVRRSLVECANDWHWSSAAFYAGIGDSPIALDPIPWDWLHVDNC